MNAAPWLRSPAKLNLALHITGRRADGYHTLQTVFQLIDLCDEMRFCVTQSSELTLEDSIAGVPDADNLIMRAATALSGRRTVAGGIRIGLRKRIPLGAGLGGGSSNAATTLLALNRLWQCGLSLDELTAMGARLGADVPVFVRGHSAVGEGIGEILSPLDLPPNWYLIVHPGCAVNTAAIFKDPELTRDTPPMTIAGLLAGPARNDCEPVARKRFPEIDQALAWLSRLREAHMSGTGSGVFAAFASAAEAEYVGSLVPARWQWFIARGINRSPVHEALIG